MLPLDFWWDLFLQYLQFLDRVYKKKPYKYDEDSDENIKIKQQFRTQNEEFFNNIPLENYDQQNRLMIVKENYSPIVDMFANLMVTKNIVNSSPDVSDKEKEEFNKQFDDYYNKASDFFYE